MKNTIERVTNTRCTGCTGCFNACPEGAIEMKLSAEGFYRPVLDHGLCTDCGLCVKRCPELSWKPPLRHPPAVFAAWATDDEVRMSSSSGGIFSELARLTIERGGAVAACAWSKDWEPEHVVVRSWGEVARLRGSKYIPSRMGSIIREIVELAEGGKETLFCGTPCQVAAVDIALPRKIREKVVLADLICHGVPSLGAFSQYRDSLFPDGLVGYEFRAKTRGWHRSSVRATTKPGREYEVIVTRDQFQQAFQVHHVVMMDACHDCRFQGGPRPGDITLGDFWGVPEEWTDKRGVSVILANTPKTCDLVGDLSDRALIETRKSNFATAAAGNPRLLSGLQPKPLLRTAFMRGLANGVPFPTLARRYFPLLRIAQAARMIRTSKGRAIILSKTLHLLPGLGR